MGGDGRGVDQGHRSGVFKWSLSDVLQKRCQASFCSGLADVVNVGLSDLKENQSLVRVLRLSTLKKLCLSSGLESVHHVLKVGESCANTSIQFTVFPSSFVASVYDCLQRRHKPN